MRSYISIILVVLITLTISGTQPASAEILTVKVEGVVDYFETGGGLALDGSVDINSVMTGYFIYDTETPKSGRGYPLISISATIGNYIFTHNPESNEPAYFKVIPWFRTTDYFVSSFSPWFDGTIYVDGSPKTYDDITWCPPDWVRICNEFTVLWIEYLRGGGLPDFDSWPDLSTAGEKGFYILFGDRRFSPPLPHFSITGRITSLTVIPEWIEATVDVDPDTLNLASKGKWLTFYISLPEEYDVADIDIDTIRLQIEQADRRPIRIWLVRDGGRLWFDEDEQVMMVGVERSLFQRYHILEPGEAELTITGQLTDGTRFKGTDTIRVIDKGGRK